MITADVEALAHKYCDQGVPVEFEHYSLSHTDAFVPFAAEAIPYLTERLAGIAAPPSNCSSIPVGASIAPIPVPAPPKHRGHHKK
jgi:hypothetical protein